MAQREVPRAPPLESNASTSLTEKEILEIQQYERIVRFRDTVLFGNHATIKLPPGLKALPSPISSQTNTSSESGVKTAIPKNQQSLSANAQAPEVGSRVFDGVGAGTRVPAPAPAPATTPTPQPVQKTFGSGKTEINPILLEKSNELIKAELQLQRQRLERSLRDEVEQRRVFKQAESLVAFDLSDVLARAMTLAQAIATPLPADEDLTANNEAASDSFDDNTFYSSRHDTPESNLTSRIRNLSEEAQVHDALSTSQREPASQNNAMTPNHSASLTRDNHAVQSARQSYSNHNGSRTNNTPSRPERVVVPGLNNHIDGGDSSSAPGPATSGEPSQSGDSGNTDLELRAPQHGHDPYADMHPPSPLIRNHEVLPVAPQSARVSPLATASERTPRVNVGVTTTAVGAPAQVAALRSEPGIAPNSDTSSQGGRDSDKKKGKKKRKAERQAPEAEAGPYIKAEPRSPSPMTAPSFIRPNKRQRHSQGQPGEPGYAEPRYTRPQAIDPYGQSPSQTYREERVPIGYQGSVPYPQRAAVPDVIGEARYVREYVDERQVPGDAYIRRPLSPGAPSYQYSAREAHPARAVSQVIANDPYREPPRIYREPLEGPRMSVRPEGEAFIVPPKPAPTRIVVDAYGREYIEPPRPSVRQSVAPSVRPGEPEIIYERVAPHAVSGHPGVGPYDDGSVVYARPPPAYAISRRYVTQPEYLAHDYRDRQHREYSSQPMGSSEFVQVVGGAQDRRHVDERPREYVTRATSLRPPEPTRFEAPYGRMHSVRPEATGREYGGSMHTESRHPEGAPAYVGEYGGGPMQQPYVRREYSVRPAERYHEPQGVTRGADEIAFIERPRGATQEIVYVDDARREVYR